MLYLLAKALEFEGVFNLVRYLSFRTGAAVATALFLGLLIGPKFIGWLRVRQGKGQPIREDGPQSHFVKRGTPTMGGLMILTSIAISVFLWMDLSNIYVWACIFVTLGFGRSEEHTSALQSLMRISYAVFCLKKNKTYSSN